MTTVLDEKFEKRWDEAPDEIKDAVFSDGNNDELDRLGKEYGLDSKQEYALARICFSTFLGFISTKDVYNHLLEFFSGNAKQAYDTYVALDEKLFKPVQGILDQFRKEVQGEAAAVSRAQTEVPPVEQTVDLKKQAEKVQETPVVNLKKEAAGPDGQSGMKAPQPVVIRAEPIDSSSSQTPPIASKVQLVSPHTLRESWMAPEAGSGKVEVRNEKPEIKNEKFVSPSHLPPLTSVTEDTGPVILHTKEEAVPIAQINKYKEYKNVSAGGFLGSFGNMFLRRQEPQAPHASVEIPQAGSRDGGQDENEVPLKVKKFGDEQKTVHYSDFKTYISRRDEI